MEPPSAPARQGHVPSQGLLLAVSLLTFWNPPTTAQLTLELVPSSAAEGKDVLFLFHNLPENRVGYTWYKGGRVDSNNQIASYVISTQVNNPGPAYSDREIIYPNGSLLFKNVNQQDTGYYTGQVIKTDLWDEITTGQLRVYPELPKPNITTNNFDPVEHKDPVVLMCEPETPNTTTYLWLINSQSVPDSARLELSKDNRTLTLLHVTRNDIGPYECESRNPVSAGRSDPFYLNVLYGPEAPNISPSDTHYRPGANLSLSCHAASNPPAQYSWLINGRPKLATQEIIIPNITVNDSGSYTCLIHNSVTGLNSSTVRTITVSELVREPSLLASKTIVTEYKDLVFLTCLTNDTGISIRWVFSDQSLWLMERMKLSQDSSTLTIDPIRVGDAGDYQCEVSNPVSSSKSARITLDVIAEKNSTGRSRWTITGIMIGVLVGVVLAATLGCFLFLRSTRRASDGHDLREHWPPASTPGHGPSGTTTASLAPLSDPKAAVPIYQELLNPNTSIYCRIDGKADVAS